MYIHKHKHNTHEDYNARSISRRYAPCKTTWQNLFPYLRLDYFCTDILQHRTRNSSVDEIGKRYAQISITGCM